MYFGALNSLAQLVLKLTCPGVPDIYRGTELWDFSLVDPDNRRPVNYDFRQQLLSDLRVREFAGDLRELYGELLENWKDGRIKMWTAMRVLRFRREHGELFQHGSYEPLTTGDEREQHVISYIRKRQGQAVIVAVPRFAYTLMKGDPHPPIGEAVWQDNSIAIPEITGEAENVLTGETIRLRDSHLLCRELFSSFPAAVLSVR
jgi:(1->4)-alpha-D-glucan 1-alpha-D-glucosylmutase